MNRMDTLTWTAYGRDVFKSDISLSLKRKDIRQVHASVSKRNTEVDGELFVENNT